MRFMTTGEVCGGTALEVNVESERDASPGTAKHQVTPLGTGGLEDCHVMPLVLKHKLDKVALLYSPSVRIFFRIWGRMRKWWYVFLQKLEISILTFRGPFIVIYSYNKTNEMHSFLEFIF